MTATVGSTLSYDERLRTLSQASVEKNFDPFTDIEWDSPEFQVSADDPRWVLPAIDALGGTQWYQDLPLAEQIRVGMYRQANIAKVGLQFEQILISGIMNHALRLPNDSAEFRYSTHEATEECNHTQMFQELVNRIGVDVPGGPAWFRAIGPLLSLAAGPLPMVFWTGVLAGEEPIDYLQKTVLRSGDQLHPMVTRVMQIHIAEEARHIGFAHQYMENKAAQLNPIERAALSVAMPIIMRILCDVIMKPSREVQRDLGIPDEVMKQVWWDSEHSARLLSDTFSDVRSLAMGIGLMNPVSRTVWKVLGIGGSGSRFRSQPRSAAA